MESAKLPSELIVQILSHIFTPWSAVMLQPFGLQPIPHAHLLRTNRLIYEEGTRLLKQHFTGEFSRGHHIVSTQRLSRYTGSWCRWIMAHTTHLRITEGPTPSWYIPSYWMLYPILEKFSVFTLLDSKLVGRELALPLLQERISDCDERREDLMNGYFGEYYSMLDGILMEVSCDLYRHNRNIWPEMEFYLDFCDCHGDRQITISIKHMYRKLSLRSLRTSELENVVEEVFWVEMYQHELGVQSLLLHATVTCVPLWGEVDDPTSIQIDDIEVNRRG